MPHKWLRKPCYTIVQIRRTVTSAIGQTMTNSDEVAQLRERLQRIEDRMAILDCVMNQARGHDRHDADLMTSVYFHDGIDEHGPVVKAGPEYGEWANTAHSK